MRMHAPAKINLSFRIAGRRPDGFHEIETLMAPISLRDELELEAEGEDIRLQCDDPSLPVTGDNLVVRAAEAFARATGIRRGWRITLQKQIPHGAGLGGGSSDAATTLLALNRHEGEPLSPGQLTEIAGGLGADVPFFLQESAAICRGKGEQVTPSPLASPVRLLLLKPAFGVPTPWAYSRWREAKELPGIAYGPQTFAGQTFFNDLERPVFEKFVFLARLKMWLLEQAEVGAALMSGSGSTVFAALREGAKGEDLAGRARAELDPDLWSCVCETA